MIFKIGTNQESKLGEARGIMYRTRLSLTLG
jgi:hypothetical protein